MRYPEPSDRENTFPRWLRITSMQVSMCSTPERKERSMDIVVEYMAGGSSHFSAMSVVAEALGIEYSVVKMHLYKRRHGLDPVSTDKRGNKVRIYEN